MLRSLSRLAGSAALGQLIQVVGMIALTVWYEPAAYGTLAVATSASAFIAVVVGLQLPFAVSVASTKNDQDAILMVIWRNVAVISAIALPIVIVDAGSYVLAAIIGSAVCLGNAGKALAVTRGDHTIVSVYYVARAITIVAIQLSLKDLGNLGLTLGLAAGEAISSFALAYAVGLLRSVRQPFRAGDYRRILSDYRAFTGVGVVQELVAICVVLIPFLVADQLFTKTEVGNFGMAHRLIWGPAAIVGANVGWLVLTELGRGNAKAASLLERRSVVLALLCSVLAATGLFQLAVLNQPSWGNLGEWNLAIELAPAIFASAATFLVSVPYRQIFRSERKQKTQFYIDLMACVGLLSFFAAGPDTIADWIKGSAIIVVLQNCLTIFYGQRTLGQGRNA